MTGAPTAGNSHDDTGPETRRMAARRRNEELRAREQRWIAKKVSPAPPQTSADDPEKPTVIIMAQDFRLPEVLRHIEAGRIVLVIPADTTPREPPTW